MYNVLKKISCPSLFNRRKIIPGVFDDKLFLGKAQVAIDEMIMGVN